jgi:hypothetical protein
MGMLDWYQPHPDLRCPACGEVMTGWQGKDGPCAFLVWRQGAIEAADQPIEEDARLDDERIRAFRLPARFVIYGGECRCSSAFAAICETDEEGRWVSTQLVASDQAGRAHGPRGNT